MFSLCHGNCVVHCDGEENLISLDILLSNPPFFLLHQRLFMKLAPTFLFKRAGYASVQNPPLQLFLISCGIIKGSSTQVGILSENGNLSTDA